MNSIQRMSFFQYLLFKIRLPWLRYKWMRERNITFMKLIDFINNAELFENKIQSFRKQRDELELTKERNRDGYFEIKGFVDGLDWVLNYKKYNGSGE